MSAADFYRSLSTHRAQFERLAEEAAEVTIPKIFPRSGENLHTTTPWHSQPGLGVSNLASRLLLSLFPPLIPFFALEPSEAAMLKAQADGAAAEEIADLKATVNKYLQSVTRLIGSNLSRDQFRSKVHLALLHIVVTGNSCIDLTAKKGIAVHTLRDFTVERDPSDNLLSVMTCKKIALSAVPEEIRVAYLESKPTEADDPEFNANDHKVNVYTIMERTEKGWKLHQEVETIYVEGSEGTYPLEAPPLIPLRFRPVAGHAYGTGHIDDLIGDIRTLHTLQRSLSVAAEEAAKVYWLKRPGSQIQTKDLQKPTGSVLIGEPTDLHALRADKGSDMGAAYQQMQAIEQRLDRALLSASPRNAERVTAAEIRLIAQQLEEALGGAYSALASEAQSPLAHSYLLRAQRSNEMPTLPREDLDIRPTTGLDALGRNQEAQNYSLFVQELTQLLGPEAAQQYIRVPALIQSLAGSYNIDPVNVRSEDEVNQIQQQQAQQAQAEQVQQAATAPLINAASSAIQG